MTELFDEIFPGIKVKHEMNSEDDKLEELRELEKDLEALRKRVFKMRRELGR